MTENPSALPLGLIADIGGTNARFALVGTDGVATPPLVLKCAEHESPAAAAEAFLARTAPAGHPSRAAFAVASPVVGDRVSMTNHAWNFSIEETRLRLGLERLDVVNDFVAVALAAPRLGSADKVAVSRGIPDPAAPVAVLGPGTGLGVAALVPDGKTWLAVPGEGGHATMAAANDREAAIIAWLRTKGGHVSAERLLSGPGLVNIHDALRALSGKPPAVIAPADLSAKAESGDPLARETFDIFFSMLGTLAGNVALTLGARGGVVLAGGILPRPWVLDAFLVSDFPARFVAKGRFQPYLSEIPVAVAIHPFPAFLGLAGLLTRESGG